MKRVTLAAFLAAGVLLVGCGGGGGGDGGGNGNGNGNGNGGDKTAFPSIKDSFPEFNHEIKNAYISITYVTNHSYDSKEEFIEAKDLIVEREKKADGFYHCDNLTQYFLCGRVPSYLDGLPSSQIIYDGGEFVVTDIGEFEKEFLGFGANHSSGFSVGTVFSYSYDQPEIPSFDIIGGRPVDLGINKKYAFYSIEDYSSTIEKVKEYAEGLEGFESYEYRGKYWYIKWGGDYTYKFAYSITPVAGNPFAVGYVDIHWAILVTDSLDKKLYDNGYYGFCDDYGVVCEVIEK